MGYIYESFIFGKTTCDTTVKSIFNKCLPFLLIYGIAAIILAFLDYYLNNINIFGKIIIATIIITLMECIIGNISYLINNYKTWDYSNMLCSCNGFISLEASLLWASMSFIFFILNPIKL